jgi:hypothetical protein
MGSGHVHGVEAVQLGHSGRKRFCDSGERGEGRSSCDPWLRLGISGRDTTGGIVVLDADTDFLDEDDPCAGCWFE